MGNKHGLRLWTNLQKRKKEYYGRCTLKKDEDVEALLCAIFIIKLNWVV